MYTFQTVFWKMEQGERIMVKAKAVKQEIFKKQQNRDKLKMLNNMTKMNQNK